MKSEWDLNYWVALQCQVFNQEFVEKDNDINAINTIEIKTF